jgi:23S rRNA (adenine2503-C2)-methyltransferase
MKAAKPLIYDLEKETLRAWFKEQGQPQFRAEQVWTALYQSLRSSPEKITTLPKDLRETLGDNFSFTALSTVREIKSRDGQTIKTLFKLHDGNLIEAVLMYYQDRRTLCISSQSGCGIGCSFCATGQMGFRRNLSSGEIIAQVLFYARMLAENGEKVTNIVIMGMGEPFQNYQNLMEALARLNDPDAMGLGARRITISTVGLTPKIRQFADEETQYNLAISLHTVDDELRSKLIPINKRYPVGDLLEACRYYVQKTNRRITFEYALIQGVNDSIKDAEALAEKLKDMLCHVNLIPLNPTEGFFEQPSSSEQVEAFCHALEDKNIPCTIRLRRGIEIQAGCGQLAAENQ